MICGLCVGEGATDDVQSQFGQARRDVGLDAGGAVGGVLDDFVGG